MSGRGALPKVFLVMRTIKVIGLQKDLGSLGKSVSKENRLKIHGQQ